MVIIVDLGFDGDLRPELLQVIPRIELVDKHYWRTLSVFGAYLLLDLLFPMLCRLRVVFHVMSGRLLV